VTDGTQGARKERAEEEMPDPFEQIRLLNDLDAERREDEEDNYRRERLIEDEAERHEPLPPRFWLGGWR